MIKITKPKVGDAPAYPEYSLVLREIKPDVFTIVSFSKIKIPAVAG